MYAYILVGAAEEGGFCPKSFTNQLHRPEGQLLLADRTFGLTQMAHFVMQRPCLSKTNQTVYSLVGNRTQTRQLKEEADVSGINASLEQKREK